MTNTERLISNRFDELEIPAPGGLDALARYVDLLAKWNKKINLTSLQIDPLSSEAVDRLIVEPVVAATHAPSGPLRIVDIGSGGGSPAIPFRIQVPEAGIRLIESRSKKCAFLREAIRDLALSNSSVIEGRFEDVSKDTSILSSSNLIIVRAVRIDDVFVGLARHVMEPTGVILRFCSAEDTAVPSTFDVVDCLTLIPKSSARLQVLRFTEL